MGVPLVGCPWCLVCFDKSVPPCDVQAGGLTLWVKRTDVLNARYTASLQVGAASTVDEFIARWLAQARLDMDPGLVSLRLVKRGPDRLTKDLANRVAAEEAATTLDPADTLTEAGVVDGSWLVAVFAQAAPSAGVPFTRVVTACSRVSFVHCALH